MTSLPNFSIQKSDCSNLKELIELSKTYYSTGNIINENYLTWQYSQNPYGTPFLFTSRELQSNELAGQYLILPINFSIKNAEISGSLSLNTLTHPKYQGKGLFTKMAKATYEHCEKNNSFFTIGFPNPQSYPGFVKKLNFKHLGDIPFLIYPIKPIKMLFSYFKKEKQKHGGDLEMPDIQAEKSQIKCFDFTDATLKSKYVSFWNKIKTQYAISTNKNYAYLKWRYHDIPSTKYKIYYYENKDEIQGIVILKAEHVWGFEVGFVMDLLVLQNDKQIGNALLKFSKKFLSHCKVDFIAALHSESSEYSLLKKAGFIKLPQKILPQKIHFIVRENIPFQNSKLLFELKNWKLTFGDYDIF